MNLRGYNFQFDLMFVSWRTSWDDHPYFQISIWPLLIILSHIDSQVSDFTNDISYTLLSGLRCKLS